jgi:N-acetyl-anhydromuramyl-L-alanine amidase AmpD
MNNKNNIPDSIIVHCSATRAGRDFHASDIDAMHRSRGFSQIGYHYVVCLDGTIETGRPESMVGAHCSNHGFSSSSYNYHSIGICYIGGLDANGKEADTRTPEQKESIRRLIQDICSRYKIIEVLGHRDTSPDTNKDGIVESYEWTKQCPCYDVRKDLGTFLDTLIVRPDK